MVDILSSHIDGEHQTHRQLLSDEERQRVLLVTTGSRGDVQPYIAFSNRLIELGHEVFFASHAMFEGFIRNHACPEIIFVPLEGNPGEILKNKEFIDAFYDNDMKKQFAIMKQEFESTGPKNMDIVVETALKYNVTSILSGIVNITESLVAGHLMMIPVVVAATIPFFPSGDFVPVGFPLKNSVKFINRGLHKLAHFITWKILQQKLTEQIRKKHNLPLMGQTDQNSFPEICIFSPHIFPRPEDWPSTVQLSGYWVINPKEGETLSMEIMQFLEEGEPPIYMGFGSMPIKHQMKILKGFEEALKATNQRGIFCGGWSEIDDFQPEEPSKFLLIKEAPHELLLSKCKLAIHHGGAGTTGASCRAGIPTLIYSVIFDQPFWAFRMAQLGIGPIDPIPLKDFNVGHLVQSIKFCLGEGPQLKAKELSEKLLAEDGVENGLRLFLDYANSHRNLDPNYRVTFSPDSETPSCQLEGCATTFGFFTRRYHCVCCGRAFCGSHTILKKVVNYPNVQPSCKKCISRFKLKN